MASPLIDHSIGHSGPPLFAAAVVAADAGPRIA